MIGVMRDWLDIPENEKRILSAVKRQRKFQILINRLFERLILGYQRMKMEAAARVIQASWKYYQVRQKCNHQKPALLVNASKKVSCVIIMSHFNNNFRTYLRMWAAEGALYRFVTLSTLWRERAAKNHFNRL